jgi:hypothetical protein
MKLERISHFCGRYSLIAVVVICLLVWAGSSFGVTLQATRSEAMGGTRTAFPDEASVVFLNPAAISNIDETLFYSDYSNNRIREVKAAFVVPLEKLGIGLSLCSRRNDENEAADYIAAGVSKIIFSGTPDTYIEIGANFRIERFAFDFYSGCSACGKTRLSESDVTGDIGIILRPLPVVSFRYIDERVRKTDKLDYDSDIIGEKGRRVGATLYLRDKLVVSWGREYRDSSVINHYGFCLKTGVPLELMAGFSGGEISGGARLKWGFLRVSFAFSQDGKEGIHQRISFEIAPGQFSSGIAE